MATTTISPVSKFVSLSLLVSAVLSISSGLSNVISICVPPVKSIPSGRPNVRSEIALRVMSTPEKVNQIFVCLMIFMVGDKVILSRIRLPFLVFCSQRKCKKFFFKVFVILLLYSLFHICMRYICLLLAVLFVSLASCSFWQETPQATFQEVEKVAIQKLDESICDELSDEKEVTMCKEHVYYRLAQENDDLSWCDKIVYRDLLGRCHTDVIFGKARKGGDPFICEKLQSADDVVRCKDLIISDEALENLDIEGCRKVEIEKIKMRCFNSVATELARKERNPDYCKLIADKTWRANCEKAAQ